MPLILKKRSISEGFEGYSQDSHINNTSEYDFLNVKTATKIVIIIYLDIDFIDFTFHRTVSCQLKHIRKVKREI